MEQNRELITAFTVTQYSTSDSRIPNRERVSFQRMVLGKPDTQHAEQ